MLELQGEVGESTVCEKLSCIKFSWLAGWPLKKERFDTFLLLLGSLEYRHMGRRDHRDTFLSPLLSSIKMCQYIVGTH